jgi:uncharacterized protein YjiS (DUF1127 family)
MHTRNTKAEFDLYIAPTSRRLSEIETLRLAAIAERDAAVAGGLRRGVGAIGQALKAAFAAIAEWPRRRAVYDQLHSLSDRELADIGLTRGDISHVFDGGIATPSAANDRIAGATRAA